jgi:hypothetical protein
MLRVNRMIQLTFFPATVGSIAIHLVHRSLAEP